MVSPFFMIGQQAGQNLQNYRQTQKDTNAIESILSEAMSANDPAVLQNSISKILSQVSPERQGAAVQYLQGAMQNVEKKKQADLAEERERTAAQTAGYTPFAPAAVQAQQVKDAAKQQALAQFGLAPQHGQVNVTQEQAAMPMPGGGQERIDQPQVIETPNIKNPFAVMSDEQLVLAQGSPYKEVSAAAIAETKRREENNKQFERERTYHTQFSKPAEEKANQLRSALVKQEHAMDFARSAIESGEVGALTMNHIADITGFDSLRNAKGAQLILAAKEQLLPSLGRISAKAQNLYMEKRMASMIPQVGQRDEANFTMQEMLEGEAQIDKAYLKAFDSLAEQDMKELGYVRKDIEKRARDISQVKEDEISKRTQYRLRQIEEESKGLSDLQKEVGKKVIKGTPFTLPMAKLYLQKFGDKAREQAEKDGYSIPTVEELKIYQMRPDEYRNTF